MEMNNAIVDPPYGIGIGKMTLGSLFDGSGGFPLGGFLSGIQPVWASEIEPFPIRVTTKRLPFIKHYGDVSKMNGGEIEPVDIITFGSPCQDMSVAGKRTGLDGSRSNLFYEAVRIVKEMRCATDGKKPRYIVWENVPGAFSSNKGEDFKAVLEAVCKIKDETCDVPKCKKWESAGEILGDNFSVAWRVLDAQYWGVPQRRRRIYLVADFAGGGAGEILFEQPCVSGDIAESGNKGQGAAEGTKVGTGTSGFDGYNGQLTGDVSSTLGVNCGMSTGRNGVVLNDQGGRVMSVSEDITATLRGEEHGHQPCIMQASGFCTEPSAKSRSVGYEEERSPTLRAGVVPATVYENHSQDTRYTDTGDVAPTVLSTYGTGGNNQPFVVGTPKTLKIRCGCEGGGKGALIQEDRSATLYTVRRLTPTECARLQGFPDDWCYDLGTNNPSEDEISFWTEVWETHRQIMGKSSKPKTRKQIIKWLNNPHSDSAEYKMWGNGVALPCVCFVLTGIVSYTVSDKEYYDLANKRLEEHNAQLRMDLG